MYHFGSENRPPKIGPRRCDKGHYKNLGPSWWEPIRLQWRWQWERQVVGQVRSERFPWHPLKNKGWFNITALVHLRRVKQWLPSLFYIFFSFCFPNWIPHPCGIWSVLRPLAGTHRKYGTRYIGISIETKNIKCIARIISLLNNFLS